MSTIRDKTKKEILSINQRNKKILDCHSEAIISQVTPKNIFSGMRGITSMVCNTSLVDPEKGLMIKGYPLSNIAEKTPEEIFFLMCTGNLPTKEEKKLFQKNLAMRSEVPKEIWQVLMNLPDTTHPMTMLSIAIMILSHDSIFREKYETGLRKSDFWKSTLEDSLELIAKLPTIAAGIYRIRYEKNDFFPSYDKTQDWSTNYANMLGLDNDQELFADLMRLYMVLHCDHEGCNASAYTTRIVNSTLSDIYKSVSAGLNALAGPLHGLANQEVTKFLLSIHDIYDGIPTELELAEHIKSTLKIGKVIPGYGHAVLRGTDPRFTAILKFAKENNIKDNLLEIVKKIYKIAPAILKEYSGGKISCPYPNVDAITGALLYHFDMTRFEYYTVLFGVSRTLGFCAQAIIARGLGSPIIRPRSITTQDLEKLLEKKKGE